MLQERSHAAESARLKSINDTPPIEYYSFDFGLVWGALACQHLNEVCLSRKYEEWKERTTPEVHVVSSENPFELLHFALGGRWEQSGQEQFLQLPFFTNL